MQTAMDGFNETNISGSLHGLMELFRDDYKDLERNNVNASGDNATDKESGGQDAFLVLLMVLRIIVCVVGVVGNGMVIFVILALQEYKKAVTHWYVLQLAFADALFLLTLPFKVAEDAAGQWTFSGGMCKAKEALLFLNYYSSILFLMVMSIDRYIAVCRGFSTKLQKLQTAYIITIVVWIVSLLLCAPVLAYSNKSGIDPYCKCSYEFPKHDTTVEEKCKNKGFEAEQALRDCIATTEVGERCKKIDFDLQSLLNRYEFPGSGFDIFEEDTSTLDSNATTSGEVYELGCSYALSSAGWFGYLYFNFFVMFILPFIIMSFCYFRIAFRLRQGRIRRSSVTNESIGGSAGASGKTARKRAKSAATAKAERNRLRVTCICLVLVVLFAVCWLPFHSVHLAKMRGISGTPDFCAKLSAASALIAYLNSALNPYIYNFIGTRFGTRLRRETLSSRVTLGATLADDDDDARKADMRLGISLSATGSIRASVKKRTSSLSSGGGAVRYQPRKHSGIGMSTSTATAITKVYKGRSEMDSSHSAPCHDDESHVQDALVQK